VNTQEHNALIIVLDLAKVGLEVQCGLDDVLGHDDVNYDIPRTFPIPEEDADNAIETIEQYLNSKVIANKTTINSELCSAVQNK